MASENQINLGDCWLPYRQLNILIKNAIRDGSLQACSQLEAELNRHKSSFISLLKNPSKNNLHRETVQNASKEGITIIEGNNKFKKVISPEMVKEALLLSDLFDLNELDSLELLITSENQLSRYPEMSRGTVAVLYYYDSKRSIVSALQALVQVSNGRCWSSKLSSEMSRCVNKLVTELKEENIVYRCCEILEEFDIKHEFDMLEMNRGLGPNRYRKQVFDIMKDIRKITANIIFHYAAQTYLTRREIFKIFDVFSTKCGLENTCLDVVSTELLMAFLYAFDASFIQELDDDDRQMVKLCWIKKPEIVSDLISKLEKTEFNVKTVKSIIRLALSLSLKTISLYPIFAFEVDIDEERLVDLAIEENVFENLDLLLAANDHVFTEEFFVRRIHSMNCDFIINMSHKIKELRDKADESGRILNAFSAEAIKPFSSLSLQFEKFLCFLANFYLNDTYKLSNDFWIHMEPEKSIFSKQQVLHKFVRSLHESFFPQVLHAPVINFFRSLARTSPFNVFNLIKNSSFHSSIQFSINSLCETLNNYLNTVRGASNTGRICASSFIGFNNIHVPPQTKKMANTESVCAIIDLIREIVKNDRTCCVAVAESQQYMFIPIMVSILRCAVPREVKAQILHCFAAFATAASVSTLIWKEIESILPRYSPIAMSHPKLGQNGIAIEIEEVEVKNEEYPITIGFLELMNSLFSHYDSGLNLYQKTASENCFNFVLDSILLKTTFRVFKNEDEKWTIIDLGYKLLLNIVLKSDFTDELNTRAFNVFSQILQENLLFRHIIASLEESVSYFESHFNRPTLKDYDKLFHQVEGCCINILSLMKYVCEKQDLFFEFIRGVPGISISTFVKFNHLFNNINPKTNRQDRLVTMFRLISFSTPISINTIKLLNALCEATFEMTYLCLMQVCNLQNPGIKPEMLIHIFVECMENDSKELRRETLKFIDIYLGNSSTNHRFTFAHKLVGFESNLFSLKSVSLFGQNYTCLHSILSFFDASINLRDFIDERKLGMRILYKLCSSIHTSDIVLRVLRSSYEFNTQYLKFWDQFMEPDSLLQELLFEMTYFMRILAIDIRITSDQKLKSYYSSYINFLFKETKQPRLLKLLYSFVFVHEYPGMPNFDYFDTKELMKTISECMNLDNTIDLPLLHQKLYNEIRALGTQIGFSSSSLLRDEINKIMVYCASVNQSIEEVKQKNEFIEAWCELVQIIILCKCLQTMEEEIQSRYLTEINLELINRINDPATNEAFYKSISATIMIASCELNEIQSKSFTNITSCIRSILQVLESSSLIWSQQKKARINFYAALLYLFRLLPNPLFKEFKFSNNLLDKLTSDILCGHEVAKMLSLSILNRTDPANWLEELILNGTLNQLLLSLQSDDREIRAHKYEFIKAFYVFESKMMLLLRIFSSPNVNFLWNGLLNNVDVVNTLESLQSFDIYPYLICENPVCFKMFTYILRLMITITTTNNRQIITEFGSFISSHSILYDLIRIAPTTRETKNGRELLLLVSRLIGPLILKVNKNLQNNFIGLLPLFCAESSFKSEHEIVYIILNACVHLISSNPSNPIFEPSLANADSQFYSKRTMGLLVSIINLCLIRSNEIQNSIAIIECSLYLLWTHFNIYFSMVGFSTELLDDVERLKSQAESTFNDVFFAKIQVVSQKNVFIDALSRRIKRITHLKKNNSLKLY